MSGLLPTAMSAPASTPPSSASSASAASTATSAIPAGSRHLRTLSQVGGLLAVWFAADSLTRAFGWSMSPGVLGLLGVLVLLLSGRLQVGWVKDGANWLLGELVLFFIPCVVAVINYLPLFRREGVQLVIAVTAGTVLVMAATALAVHAGCRLEAQLEARRVRARSNGAQ
ncbi:CidA/LrgA family protein [Cupriavidus metallidurans]|uniref:CidA/LrgA family protein n=2 Tax=Cupriavidus metallidurans TaxID=119219 RepID=UPI001CCA9497|nr:CidA/LrgA family protein [Cupriavidus metallidurans]UBM12389.1 CidA/LrgA family protein [Cupriavidus metallidurans]